MTKAFVIVSVSDRVDELNELMDSIDALPEMAEFARCLLFQDPDGVADKIKERDRYHTLIVKPQLMGCHAARVHLLKRIRFDHYVNLDDDMLLTEHTHYAEPLTMASIKGTGFVLTNWARTRALLDAKVPKMERVFKPQIMVYQGGGMVYGDEVADLMRALPEIPQTFDHAWPLTAYINGFRNYRYQGSLAVHKVCTLGGMRTFMDNTPAAVMMTEFVDIKPTDKDYGPGRSLKIPLDKDVTKFAHARHKHMRIKMGLS